MSTEAKQPELKGWRKVEAGCLATYAGGHHSDGKLDAFQHGMRTVFNMLDACYKTPEDVSRLEAEKAELVEALDWLLCDDVCEADRKNARAILAKHKG